MQKRYWLLILFFAPVVLLAQSAKINVAIIDLESQAVAKSEALSITDELRSQILKVEAFNVIERSRMNEIIAEQGLQSSDMCNSAECYVEMGQMMGVEKLIVGSIGKVGEIFILSIRMIDVKTGKIILDVSEKVKGSVEDVLMNLVPQVVEKLKKDVYSQNLVAAVEVGAVSIACNVKDADVFIDGKFVGRAPVDRKPVASGSHTIRVVRSGYEPGRAIVEFGTQREQKELNIQLKLKNANGALWRSLALPGWGQLYNEQKGKAYVMAGAEGAMLVGFAAVLVMANASYDDYQAARQMYSNMDQGLPAQKYNDAFALADSKFKTMQSNQTLVMVMGVACGVVWAYNVVDAWLLGPDFSAAGKAGVKTSLQQQDLPLLLVYKNNVLYTGLHYSF